MPDPTTPDTLTAAAELQTIANALIGESVIADRPGQMTRLEVLAADVRKIAARLPVPTSAVDRQALAEQIYDILNDKIDCVPMEGHSYLYETSISSLECAAEALLTKFDIRTKEADHAG